MQFDKGNVLGISCVIGNQITVNSIAEEIDLDTKQIDKIIETTGFQKLSIVPHDTDSLDLAEKAAADLLNNYPSVREEVDTLIVVSQSNPYRFPQISNILQDRLGLGKHVLALDLPLGCSGYVMGLLQGFSLLKSGQNKVLLVTTEVNSKLVDKKDHAVSTIFGDAATATLLSNDKAQEKVVFDFGSDGSGIESLRCFSDLHHNFDTSPHIYMNGLDVMNFAIRTVPTSVKKISSGTERIYLHQANRFMISYIAKKLKRDLEDVPFLSEDFGNTGPNSIPLCIVMDKMSTRESLNEVILSGFGVGLSWASVKMSLEKLDYYKLLKNE